MKTVCIFCVVFGLLISSMAANANPANSHWKPSANASLYKLVFEKSGKIISTNSVEWPDGRSAQVQYIKTDEYLFKCVDYMDSSFVNTSNFCWVLVGTK